ncbi:MAG: hypothetical protein AAF098_18325 [Pseudomonadota bacterium]
MAKTKYAVKGAHRGLLLSLCLVLYACDPVVPAVEIEDWYFEDFQVYSYVPAEPRGIVYFFHGSGGSAEFALRVETLDLINGLLVRGYGFIATESTERTAPRRWQVNDPSLQDNPDLSRLARLHRELQNRASISEQTPIFGVGMSNGARMVSLFAQTFHNAAYPVHAIVPVMGTVANPVAASGGLTVPALFIEAENDTTVENDQIRFDFLQTKANGVAAQLLTKREEPLLDWRFTRVPSIDMNEANQITSWAISTGVWSDEGSRQLSVNDAFSTLEQQSLDEIVEGDMREVRAQLANILAVHQFTALFKEHIADFFDSQLAHTTEGASSSSSK